MEETLRLQLLRAIVSDRAFLKSSHHNITADSFATREERILATAALEFYEKYQDPVGGMLRSIADEAAYEQKLGAESQNKLKVLLHTVLGGKMPAVSIRALEDSVVKLKHASFFENAVEDILAAHDAGKFNARILEELVERASKELTDSKVLATDYFSELAERIQRRKYFYERNQFPKLLIPELDSQIRAIGRGHTGLFLAPYSSGKGMALVGIDLAYALQSLNVLHITLEDPREEVEARLDSCVTGLKINRLNALPNRLTKRFERLKRHIHGKIRIIDGTAETWTVSKIERVWEQLVQEGFVADCVVVDYDAHLACEKSFKGDNVQRFEIDEIYKRLNRFAAKRNIILWTAAQTGRAAEGRKLITGRDAAEDINKIRRCFLAIGIGKDPDVLHGTYLYICRHRLDKSRFGVTIVSDFERGMLYEPEETAAYYAVRQRRRK